MMIYHRLLFIFVISCKQGVNSHVVIQLFLVILCLRRLHSRLFLRQKFSFWTYGTKNWRRKPAPENAADLWRRFLERMSWVLGAH